MAKGNRARKNKPTNANQNAPPTPISSGGHGDSHSDEPDNPNHSPTSPNALPTPNSGTEPQQPTEKQQEITDIEPAPKQPAVENIEGGNGHEQDDRLIHGSPKSSDDEEKTPVARNDIEPELSIKVEEASNKTPISNGTEERVQDILSQGQQSGSGGAANETGASGDEVTIDESKKHIDGTLHSADIIMHEELGKNQDSAIPPVPIEYIDFSKASLSEQDVQNVDVTPTLASTADGQEQPKNVEPFAVNNVEECQESNDAHMSSGDAAGDSQGDKGLADSDPHEFEGPSNSSRELEGTQEQGNNELFFDSVENLGDYPDEDKTLTEDQDMDDTDFQASKDGHEQVIYSGNHFFRPYDLGTTELSEQHNVDPWGLASPDNIDNPYELQIIIEQPEEDVGDSHDITQRMDAEPNHATDTVRSGVNESGEEFEIYENDAHEELPAEMDGLRPGAVFDISAQDIASEDILAVANVFANMKSALSVMTAAFGSLGAQAERIASIGLDVKAVQHVQQIKSNLESQIANHTAAVEKLKGTLQAKIKEAVESIIRDRLRDVIQQSVRAAVEERVRQELSTQIPDDFRKQVISHKRHILEVKASLHNSEARMYNALQTMPDVNAPLRPLLRPLPTPEQSPVVISISRSSSTGHSVLPTPATAFPQGPAPTPIRRTASNSLRPLMSDTVPPSPSPYFPRDMTTLFGLNPEETKRLLREYGLTSAAASPTVEHPTRPRGLSIVDEDTAEEDPDIHARDLNKFMAHIGVPFLMIPAPKEKHHESAPLSSRSRRRLLTPLIIK